MHSSSSYKFCEKTSTKDAQYRNTNWIYTPKLKSNNPLLKTHKKYATSSIILRRKLSSEKRRGGGGHHNVFAFFHHKTTKWSLFSEWVITAVVLCLVSVCRKMSARQAQQQHNYQPLPRLSTVANAAFKFCRKHCNYEFSTHNRPN